MADQFFGALAIRDISGDLGKTLQYTIVVAERRNDDTGPKARAILAHPPSLVFVPALLGGYFHFFRGQTLREVFRRVETREVLADDFIGAITFDFLGPRIPGNHFSLKINHYNCIVSNTIH